MIFMLILGTKFILITAPFLQIVSKVEVLSRMSTILYLFGFINTVIYILQIPMLILGYLY